jgi:dTMP kinase
MLITFEGVEGAGKSTQVDLLQTYLTNKGYSVLKTREPGGTLFGEELRRVFLQPHLSVSPLAELLVFVAMRAQHVEEVIMPALQERKIVLCDRFVDATYAYQGYGRGIDLGIIETLNRLATKGVRPNLTVLLNLTAAAGLKRKSGPTDRFEKESVAFHRRIQKAYLKLAKEDSRRFFIVDAGGSVDDLHRHIREEVERLLESHGV